MKEYTMKDITIESISRTHRGLALLTPDVVERNVIHQINKRINKIARRGGQRVTVFTNIDGHDIAAAYRKAGFNAKFETMACSIEINWELPT